MSAHLLALEWAPAIGFGKYIVSATTPFTPEDLSALRRTRPASCAGSSRYEAEYEQRCLTLFGSIERVYVNSRAREDLGWSPRYDFRHVLDSLAAGETRAPLARAVGARGTTPPRLGLHDPELAPAVTAVALL